MKEKLKYLIPAIIILGLFIPKSTSAAIFTGFFDYFLAAFEGVEEFTAPIAQLFIYLGLSYIIGLGTLFISSTVLQLIIQHPEWLSITGNRVVEIGWLFTAGLTNMFFILIFVFIALAIILKIESFQAKKALPKLLIMALLVNFSLLFVGATVDISNIFYRTIVPSDGNLVLDIVDVLAKGGSKTLKNIIDEIIFLVISFIVPVIGPFMQLGFVINLVSTGFVGNVLLWIVQGAMLSMMSGILFTFAFLFLARIFVLQLLAMVAPVAFLCSVLPETKKYWDDWLKMVVEWNVFGVVTLLFLVVGLQGLNSVMPPALLNDVVPTLLEGVGLSWIKIPPSLMYYFFLFVYLSTLLFFSKKYTPMMGDLLINQAKSLGNMVYTKGIKTFGKGAMAGIKHTRGRWKEISAARREQKGKEKFGTRLRMGVGSRLAKREGIVGKWGTRMMRGTTMETEEAKRVEKQVAQLKSTFGAKGEHLDDALKVGGARFKGPMKAALLQYAAETRGEAGIDKFKEKMEKEKYYESVKEIVKTTPHKVKDIVKNKSELIDGEDTPEEIRNLIRNAMVTIGKDGKFKKDEKGNYKDDDVRFIIDNNLVEINGKKASEIAEDEDGIKAITIEAAQRKAIRALDANDLKTLSYKTVNKEEFKKRAVRHRTDWNFFRKLSTVKGVDLTKFQDVADENKKVFEETTRINPNFIRSALAAGKGLMRPWRYNEKELDEKGKLDKVMGEIKGEKEVKSSEEIVKEIGQKQEKLNGLLSPRIKITEEELDKKVGTAEKAKELSEEFPKRTNDENWFNAKRFLSKKLDKAQKDLYQEKMGDPNILRETIRGMKQKNREKVKTLQKEIKQSKEKLKKRKEQERKEIGTKVKELKLTSDEQTEINNRANEIFNELSKDKDKEPYKIFERMADFEGFTPNDKTLRMYAEHQAKTEKIEDTARERKAALKKPIVPPVKKEEKLPSWEKEFLNKRNQYQKEVDKYNESLKEGDKEIEEIDNKLKSLRERLDADSKGEIILSKIERKDIPRETIRLNQEKDNKLFRRGNIIAKIEKREKIVDEIGKEMKLWKKRPEEEYKEEKELTKSSLRGALKFIPSEIKEPLREGREARDQLSRSLADYESVVKEKRVLQKKIKLLEVDVNLRKEEEKEFGAGVHTKRKTAVKETELKNLQGRLDNIIEKRISALRKEINEQKTILTKKKSDIKKETDRAEGERKKKEARKGIKISGEIDEKYQKKADKKIEEMKNK